MRVFSGLSHMGSKSELLGPFQMGICRAFPCGLSIKTIRATSNANELSFPVNVIFFFSFFIFSYLQNAYTHRHIYI